MVSVEDEWAMVAAARSGLADLGATLEPEQWEVPSLCEGWQVRHVFAHVVMGAVLDLGSFLPFLVRSAFRVNRAQRQAVIAFADAQRPEQLVADLRSNADDRKLLPGSTPAGALAEVVVHGQDIRRPLGMTSALPGEWMTVALGSMVRTGFGLGNKRRIAGLRLVATDLDWSHGEGPEVRGPAETLLMATCGRDVAMQGVTGPGTDVLWSRMP